MNKKIKRIKKCYWCGRRVFAGTGTYAEGQYGKNRLWHKECAVFCTALRKAVK